MTERPNVLFIMTDEERYPPPHEAAALAEFRRTQLRARERLRAQSRELHRHYAGATACTPSRTTLFTGQYPSLHGVADTAGLAKQASDPAMHFLDPDTVPTMGDWFRADGYRTHCRGKWHVSHPDLTIPGTYEGKVATSHVDLIPTLLGVVGADIEAAAAEVLTQLRTVLADTRESMRRTPRHVNPRA